MRRPVLRLQTVYFADGDRESAQRLGMDLFHHLTRPAGDPLGYGANIPVLVGVSADRVDLDGAEEVVLLPVLGKSTYTLNRDDTVKQIQYWHDKLGPGRVLPVPTSTNWRGAEKELPGTQMLTELYSAKDPRRRTLDEVVIAVSRLLDPSKESLWLFVSHAKADLKATKFAAQRIHDYVVTEGTAKAFFDKTDVRPGESLARQLEKAAGRGVVIAVRSDAYGSREWCQQELLEAKQRGNPTITVEILRSGEQRSSPYGGNNPCLVWRGDPAPIVARAMVEWLRATHFRREAPRIIEAARLPDDVVVVTRPPELLDLARGPLRSRSAQLALHPDPELPVIERQVLQAARPRLRLVTPTTAFRRMLMREDGGGDLASPLEGIQVAMSLSETPHAGGPEGYTFDHVIDATVHLARTLISAGAAIAYGGDFRKTKGFTPLLVELIRAYNQTASTEAQNLHSYLAATISPEDVPDGLPIRIHHPSHPSGREEEAAIMAIPSRTLQHPEPLYISDMRRMMALQTQARVILGGQLAPQRSRGGPGYRGRYPGILEEAWRTVEAKRPLYVLGGFGGAAASVADLLEGKPTPDQLRDKTWEGCRRFNSNAEKIDGDPFRVKLGLPRRIEDLAQAIRKAVAPLLRSDKSASGWNGLTLDENRRLWRSRDPVELAALVLKGLLAVIHQKSRGKLRIELVHDSLTAASGLDAIAIATIDDVPLGGAGAILDQRIGGRASAERKSGGRLVSLAEASSLDASWLIMARLGGLGEGKDMEQRVEGAAAEAAGLARRHGFRRLGVVTFGGNILSNVESIARAMLKGFRRHPPTGKLVWFETNDGRFEALRAYLDTQPSVGLTTRQPQAAVETETWSEPLLLDVRLQGTALAAAVLPPSATAVASIRRTSISLDTLAKFSIGGGQSKRMTPDSKTLRKTGADLAKILFGSEAGQILDRCRNSKLVVVHDIAASKLPFEILATQRPDVRPAVESGITRRLVVESLPIQAQFARPPKKGKLNLLLIADPTEDLPGARQEADAVIDILKLQTTHVELNVLDGKRATKRAICAALKNADVLHYCGHAFFMGSGPGESGLLVAGRRALTATDLGKIDPPPRMAFVNSCEAGRVRGGVETEAAAFAELFLRSGVEAYLGTYWRVSDEAAVSFASTVYLHLASGETLEAAVLKARKSLLEDSRPDWANYILFGSGNFRLVVS